MRDWIAKLTPSEWLAKKLLMALVLAAACTGAFFWGKRQHVDAKATSTGDPFGLSGSDGRTVAFIGNMPIMREELGEYLIARFGAERLEFMVNRKIVEMEARKHGIGVTDSEVEYRFREELGKFGPVPLTEAEFVKNILGRFKKSLYEWKEDVIRPKLMMEKLVKSQIKVTDQEVADGFEARFGPKVECRMIVMQPGNSAAVQEMWNKVKNSREQFIAEAKKQYIPALQEKEGLVPPINRHFGDKSIEDWAFKLKVNEVSEPIRMPDGNYVLLMCEKHIPKDVNVRFDTAIRMKIHQDIEEIKLAQKIPEVFAKLHQEANPRLVLQNSVHHLARVEAPQQSGLNAFDNVPSGNLPNPTNLPAPVPTKVLAPDGHGVVPTIPQAAPAPISGLPPITLPKIDAPAPESKKN